jgi:hypothetical protein
VFRQKISLYRHIMVTTACACALVSAVNAQTGNECEKLKALNEQTLRDLHYEDIPALAAKMRQLALDEIRLSDEVTKCLDNSSGLLGAPCDREITAYNRAVQEFESVSNKVKWRQQTVRDQLLVNRHLHPCG